MAQIIAINSFRRGVGRSNITANLATLAALRGVRVGAVDANIQSPSLHYLYGIPEDQLPHLLNEYLRGQCSIEQISYDITASLKQETDGRLYLIPTSAKTEAIIEALHKGFDANLLLSGFEQLIQAFDLDLLFVDTQPGLNEETLLAMSGADVLIVLLRTDQQDYQGTAITMQLARKLEVPRLMLIVNEVPMIYDFASVAAEVSQSYGAEVMAVLPHYDEMMLLASSEIFVLNYPDHPMTAALQHVTQQLL